MMTHIMRTTLVIYCLTSVVLCLSHETEGEIMKESVLIVRPPAAGEAGDELDFTGSTQSVDEMGRPKRWVMIGHRKWTRMPVTISFKNFLPTISRYEQVQILKECLTMWSEASGISFRLVNKRTCPRSSRLRCTDIEVQYLYLDGPWNVAGRGLSPTPTWTNSTSSWLKLDTAETWKARHRSYSSKSALSLKWAMCHEVGHNIALGHTSVNGAYMSAGGRFGHLEDVLHQDDIKGVRSLYGPPNGKTVIVDKFPYTRPPPTTLKPTTKFVRMSPKQKPAVRLPWRVTTQRPVRRRGSKTTVRPFTYTSPKLKTLTARSNEKNCPTFQFSCVWNRFHAKKLARRG